MGFVDFIDRLIEASPIVLLGILLVAGGSIILCYAVKSGFRFGWGVWRPGSPFNRLALGAILIVGGIFFLGLAGLIHF
ncbi:MAG: hypothetical protein LBL86_03170 [Coriobacteriales bacterium]|jgi:hypothetical protein|nr:hypothetical protein [Coriobacteriales bacterium]